jgi:CRP/FNR family transcriptional regulator, cyclic AMP receptor protein
MSLLPTDTSLANAPPTQPLGSMPRTAPVPGTTQSMPLRPFVPADGAGKSTRTTLPRLLDHTECEILSTVFRGKLCDQVASGPTRRIAAGEFLYHAGGDARSTFLLRQGLVKTSVVSPGGQELTLRVYKAGDVIGELCLCTGERREQAVALEASDVIEIPIETFTARLREDPLVALEFATTVCERLADAHERLRSLAVDPVLGRLVRTLLSLAADLGKCTPQGTLLTHYLAQEELAQLVGARREVVSTMLNRLREKGLLTYTRRGLIRLDRPRLDKLQQWLDTAAQEQDPMLAR